MELEKILEQIQKIEKELAGLNGIFVDWAETYQGESFDEQTALAVCLENQVHAVTHEIASEIGFTREYIKKLVLFIEFRKRWKQFSDKELCEILDSYMVPFSIKKQLMETIEGNVCDMLDEIRCEWNKLFSNMNYGEFRDKILAYGSKELSE